MDMAIQYYPNDFPSSSPVLRRIWSPKELRNNRASSSFSVSLPSALMIDISPLSKQFLGHEKDTTGKTTHDFSWMLTAS